MSPIHVAGAAFFVACGYVTLALYDWFALRTIGARQVPFRVAALAGATSYAIGHSLGAMVFASAAIRFRIYSRFGVSLIDIAKILLHRRLDVLAGQHHGARHRNGLYAGGGARGRSIPSWGNQTIGIAALSALSAYLLWVWSKTARARPQRLERDAALGP